jgi:hypothetical protein
LDFLFYFCASIFYREKTTRWRRRFVGNFPLTFFCVLKAVTLIFHAVTINLRESRRILGDGGAVRNA